MGFPIKTVAEIAVAIELSCFLKVPDILVMFIYLRRLFKFQKIARVKKLILWTYREDVGIIMVGH